MKRRVSLEKQEAKRSVRRGPERGPRPAVKMSRTCVKRTEPLDLLPVSLLEHGRYTVGGGIVGALSGVFWREIARDARAI